VKIALVCDWFLKIAAEQAVGLLRAGAEVHVVCRHHLQEFGGSEEEWQERIDLMRHAGVRVSVVDGRTSSLTALRSAGRAARALRAWNPDLVHAHPSLDPWLHLIVTGYPLVVTIHDPVPHPGEIPYRFHHQALSDGWTRRADALVAHGEALAALIESDARGRPVWVIPHGLTPSPEPYPVPEAPEVLFFGRLEPYKGVAVLVAAMGEVWERRPDVRLVVAGRGPAAADVPEHPQITRLFHYIPEPEVDGLLAAATLLAAPYTEASQSGVVSLGVGRGIPAVVSDQGSLAELAIEPGLVVPAGDPAALAASILAYLDHGEDLRRRIHADAVDRLSWEATGRRALGLYAGLLEARTGRGRRA
jgi:glycosyltransferase involved in cell wall biosynthesis